MKITILFLGAFVFAAAAPADDYLNDYDASTYDPDATANPYEGNAYGVESSFEPYATSDPYDAYGSVNRGSTLPDPYVTDFANPNDQNRAGKNLGSLSSNPYDPDSTANPFGAGNPYDTNSVTNPYGEYGSPYSNKSATNPYATDAPKLYDQDGDYRGKLSSNPYDPDSISNPYGRYGNPYSSDSINNPYGAGNPYDLDRGGPSG